MTGFGAAPIKGIAGIRVGRVRTGGVDKKRFWRRGGIAFAIRSDIKWFPGTIYCLQIQPSEAFREPRPHCGPLTRLEWAGETD